jgi:hypothetical protein
MKNKNNSDGKSASDQLILSEKSGQEKLPVDKKKIATLEKERIKAEKKLKKGESWMKYDSGKDRSNLIGSVGADSQLVASKALEKYRNNSVLFAY